MRRLFRCCFYNGGFWIRIAGYGISVSDKLKHPPLFTERNGYRKVYRVGRWGIFILCSEENVKVATEKRDRVKYES